MGSIGRYMFRTTMGAFTDHPRQLDRRDVVHAGDPRIRPDHQPTANAFGLYRHHRPAYSAAGHDDRADLAGAGDGAYPQQAQLRFRDHRDECRRRISPWRLVRPLLAAGLVVSLLVAAIAVYVSPWSLRELRDWATQVRADILTNIVQPGRFTTIGGNLTFHIADRRPNGLLVGIFLDDRRDPKEHATYLAEQGEIVKNDSGSFLVLEKGSVQRMESGQRDPRIVTFDRYAFDLSKFTTGPQSVTYNTREKYIWELIWPRANDRLLVAQAGEYRSELHDRFATPLYPLAFVDPGLRVSRPAADDPAEPHAVAAGA